MGVNGSVNGLGVCMSVCMSGHVTLCDHLYVCDGGVSGCVSVCVRAHLMFVCVCVYV